MTQYQPVAGAACVSDAAAADYDRRWLVVDGDGHWLSAERAAALQTLQLSLKLGYLVVRAPGMLRLDVPLDVIEDDDSVRRTAFVQAAAVDVVDEGDLAAAWFGNLLERPCRLVKVHPDAPPVDWPQDASR